MQESSISEKIKELRTDLKMNQKNFSIELDKVIRLKFLRFKHCI